MPIIYVLVALIVPVFPAYILFKTLPSDATADGPFQGLKIKLQGAFAGYFILVLAILGFLKLSDKPPDNGYQVWMVHGRVKLDDNGVPIVKDAFTFSVQPSDINLSPDGTFDVPVLAKPDHSGTLKLPVTLTVACQGFQPFHLPLNETRVDEEDAGQLITLERNTSINEVKVAPTILLKKIDAPYDASVARNETQTGNPSAARSTRTVTPGRPQEEAFNASAAQEPQPMTPPRTEAAP
jgi:hypothetical protein